MDFKKNVLQHPAPYFLLLFICLFGYFFLIYDVSLYAHLHQPIFLFHQSYLKEFTGYPGGLFDWLSQIVEQFLYWNWIGSAILAAVFLAVFLTIYTIIKTVQNNPYAFILSFIPAGLLLQLQSGYRFPVLITIKYLIVLLFILVYMKIDSRHKPGFILLSALVYYGSGGWFYLFYMAVCLIYELLLSADKKRIVYAAIIAAAGLAYPLTGSFIFFNITFKEAYFYSAPFLYYYKPFSFQPNLLYYITFFSIPVLFAVVYLFDKKNAWVNKSAGGNKCLPVQLICMIAAAVIMLSINFPSGEKLIIEIDRLACRGKWQKLLRVSRRVDEYDRLVNFHVNRAYYHTGQLLDNLFQYPQLTGPDGLFIDKKIASQIALPASDLYFELGHMNASQAMAFEAQTKFKYHPRILKRLVLINIINEKGGIAKKIIDILKRSIFRRWAVLHERYIDEPSLAESDGMIRMKRSQRVKTDFFINNQFPYSDLTRILRENSRNKMAFEYLIAYFMLDCRMANLVKTIQHYKNPGDQRIPRHVQEVILLIKTMSPSSIHIDDYRISQYTFQRFKKFHDILSQFSGDEKKAKIALGKEFRDTFWYYLRYLNPKKTKLELMKRKMNEDIL